jgi:anthranilate synthase/aminodeoxychorismate synthase-like glutamine amidotransferase
MLLLIDNYDSFTHNLARYFVELGQEVKVVRNDNISLEEIAQLSPDYLVFSPGPCTPIEAGITMPAIKHFAGKIPILGVCLGHQAIGMVFGASLINASEIRHGKTSDVYHVNSRLFSNIHSPFLATRYHSLVLSWNSIPTDFTISAWCENLESSSSPSKEVMAIENPSKKIYGMQFHPESLLTESGHKMLNNFLLTTK